MSDAFDFGAEEPAKQKPVPTWSIGHTILLWQKIVLLGFVLFGITACCAGIGYGVLYVGPKAATEAALNREKENLRARYENALLDLDTVRFQINAEDGRLPDAIKRIEADRMTAKKRQAEHAESDRKNIELGFPPLWANDTFWQDQIKQQEERIATMKMRMAELERDRKNAEQSVVAIEKESMKRFGVSIKNLR